ncbi:glutathione S-transferase N-terminal domain-containing protein [Pseudomonas sp. ME-P-057]|uniref:glutathione S-transferase family protein n=1 Tax=Pseudomonas sp. ME-P-057 TaxID=3040321 RepID=UPI0025553BAA|nr:glutathione S-transferase N-terminal domain-containing protein [Pseudomonas sp. ME-P-057]
MLLYQFQKGTNPRRVMIYLAEKGLDVPRYELDYANGEHRSAQYLDINPSGRAPALVTDTGVAITDSAAIIEYMEECHPERPMIGTDPVSRARVRSLERLGSDLVARGQLWLWNQTGAFPAKESAPAKETADRLYGYVSELLDVLETEIGESEFLAGANPTIADFTAFPIFQTARERFNLPFGENHRRLDAWYKRFRLRPSADY